MTDISFDNSISYIEMNVGHISLHRENNNSILVIKNDNFDNEVRIILGTEHLRIFAEMFKSFQVQTLEHIDLDNLDPYRETALKMLSNLNDEYIRILLRQLEFFDLLNIVWYLNNFLFTMKVCTLLKEEDRESLLYSLEYRKTKELDVKWILDSKKAVVVLLNHIEKYVNNGWFNEIRPEIIGELWMRTNIENLDIYQRWLVALYGILNKVRKEGLISIENDIETPEKSYIFNMFNLVTEDEYVFEFASDILRMIIGGNLNVEELESYVQDYINGILEDQDIDVPLYYMIWTTLRASANGYAPQIAVEFGRQRIPFKYKMSFIELESLTRGFRSELSSSNYNKSEYLSLEERIALLYEVNN